MKVKFRYVNYRLQEELIRFLQEETDANFRIRKDRTIEYAKKWDKIVFNFVEEMYFELFEKPTIRHWTEGDALKHKLIVRMAERNIPFFEYVHDGNHYIIYSTTDTEVVCDIEREIGLMDWIYKC